MAAISMDLRIRIHRACESGETTSEAAERFDVLLAAGLLRITDGRCHMFDKIARKFVCDLEAEEVAPWTLGE